MKRLMLLIATTLSLFCVSSSSFAGGGYNCQVEVKIKSSQAQAKCHKSKQTGKTTCLRAITYTVQETSATKHSQATCRSQIKGRTYTTTFQVPAAQEGLLKPKTVLKGKYAFFSLCSKPITFITWSLKLPKGGQIRSHTRTGGAAKPPRARKKSRKRSRKFRSRKGL